MKYTTTVDGKKIEGQTTFIVKKPNIPMKAEISPGQFDVADVTYKDKATGVVVSGIELYYVTPGNVITFRRDPIKDFPGETEYVQIVQEDVRYESIDDSLTPCSKINKGGLDREYPYPSEDGGITGTDNPGAGVAMSYNLDISVKYEYDMYLLYKPDKEGAIFVPLKKIHWHWYGIAKRQRVVDKFNFKDSKVGLDSQEQEANEYPEWKVIVKSDDKLNACTKKK